jgi:hypothetical protein
MTYNNIKNWFYGIKNHKCQIDYQPSKVVWASADDPINNMIGYRCENCAETQYLRIQALKEGRHEVRDGFFGYMRSKAGRDSFAKILNSEKHYDFFYEKMSLKN